MNAAQINLNVAVVYGILFSLVIHELRENGELKEIPLGAFSCDPLRPPNTHNKNKNKFIFLGMFQFYAVKREAFKHKHEINQKRKFWDASRRTNEKRMSKAIS